jgi:hypothetical protein
MEPKQMRQCYTTLDFLLWSCIWSFLPRQLGAGLLFQLEASKRQLH